jgi:hypothetical protein
MTKKEYLKWLMDNDVDSLSEKEKAYFYDNITYEIIDEWIDETLTAALIEGITYEPKLYKTEITVKSLLKDLENKK